MLDLGEPDRLRALVLDPDPKALERFQNMLGAHWEVHRHADLDGASTTLSLLSFKVVFERDRHHEMYRVIPMNADVRSIVGTDATEPMNLRELRTLMRRVVSEDSS